MSMRVCTTPVLVIPVTHIHESMYNTSRSAASYLVFVGGVDGQQWGAELCGRGQEPAVLGPLKHRAVLVAFHVDDDVSADPLLRVARVKGSDAQLQQAEG